MADQPPPDAHAAAPIRPALAPVFVAVLFGIALVVLHRELSHYRYAELRQALAALPRARLAAALGLTALGYLALTAYDHLALRHLKKAVGLARVSFVSFSAYAFSNTLGWSVLTGGSIRYRLYSAWGLSTAEIAQAIAFCALTFWVGVLTVAGSSYLVVPAPVITGLGLHPLVVRVAGAASLLLVSGYLAWCSAWKRPITVRGVLLRPPSLALALAQVAVSTTEWLLAASVLYVLMPPTLGVPFLGFAGIFVLAQTAGVVSHVPGGLGIFEAILLVLLREHVTGTQLLASLLAYRMVYYLVPFVVAAALLVGHEVAGHGKEIARAAVAVRRAGSAVVPHVLSVATFMAGAILLISGATPGLASRLHFLDRVLPLAVIEVSHFLGSLIGLGLLLLAIGLRRRLDAAYQLTIVLLVAGAGASLLKGFDYEEATALAILLGLLLPARAYFYRRASLVAERVTPGWFAAIGVTLVATAWLGLFANRHIQYSGELWWQFALRGDAPRFLRATVGAVSALAALGLWRLLTPATPRSGPPSAAVIDRAAAVVARSPVAAAHLALTGDKTILFAPEDRGFVMYSAVRRSWIAMGDPVGAPDVQEELAWQFRELADEYGGHVVFYEASARLLPLYLDLGLVPLKLGEEAVVALEHFDLEGSERRGLRRSHRAVQRAGCSFSLLTPEQIPAALPEMEQVSNAWLDTRRTREKGFSLGRFDPRYLQRLPAGVIRQGDRMLAFATLWPAAPGTELSMDLMRHVPDAPNGIMDYLFVELMLWGKAEGFRRFHLGMAPLSGMESRRGAPLWNRLNALVFRHGHRFYNFQGLRSYKEKFRPDWSPRYLVSPGGLAIPRVLADVTTLISGGLKGVLTR